MRRRRKGTDALLTAKLDKACGDLTRSLGYCERCGRTGHKLDWAHIIGRQNFRTRWLTKNSMCLCFLCHRWWHDYPTESADWIRQHRPDDVRYLERVKNESGKWSPMEKRAMLADLKDCLVSESQGMEDEAA